MPFSARSHCNSLPCIGVDWSIVEVERVPGSVFVFTCCRAVRPYEVALGKVGARQRILFCLLWGREQRLGDIYCRLVPVSGVFNFTAGW